MDNRLQIIFTEEQAKNNRKYIAEEVNRVRDFALANNLHWAVFIHWAPLSSHLESRIAYFEEYYEASLWCTNLENRYKEFVDLPYEVFNG